MITLTKAERVALGHSDTEFDGDLDEFKTYVTQTYWVLDDAPWPYWKRERVMETLRDLASKHGFEIEV